MGKSLSLISASRTMMAASFSTRAMALRVWWSSATLGEGTRTAGLAAMHNSLMVPAPAREMTMSAER